MEMDQSLIVSRHDVFRQQKAPREVFGHFSRHIVALYAVHRGIFVGILLLDFFVVALDQRENLRVRRIRLTDQGAGITIGDIFPRENKRLPIHQAVFHHILHFFHAHGTPHMRALVRDAVRNRPDVVLRNPSHFVYFSVRLSDRIDDFLLVKNRFLSASFDNLHFLSLSFFYFRRHNILCVPQKTGTIYSISDSVLIYYTISCGKVKYISTICCIQKTYIRYR